MEKVYENKTVFAEGVNSVVLLLVEKDIFHNLQCH